MKKRKWLFDEMDGWVEKGLITRETALRIQDSYPAEESRNTLLIVFSIVGAILNGSGIILISAKNWYDLPVGVSRLPVVSAACRRAGARIFCILTAPRRNSLARRGRHFSDSVRFCEYRAHQPGVQPVRAIWHVYSGLRRPEPAGHLRTGRSGARHHLYLGDAQLGRA